MNTDYNWTCWKLTLDLVNSLKFVNAFFTLWKFQTASTLSTFVINILLIKICHHYLWRATECGPFMGLIILIFNQSGVTDPFISRLNLPLKSCICKHPGFGTLIPMMVISEDQWHSHLLPSVWQWSCHFLFLRRRLRSTACEANALHLRHRGGLSSLFVYDFYK